MPVNSRSAPSASDASVVLISPQLWVPGSRDSRSNFFSSRHLPEVAEETLPEVTGRVQPLRRVRPVSDRRKLSGLGEANEVGWDGDAYVVSSAQQLATEGDTGLDVTASSVERQYKFHRGY